MLKLQPTTFKNLQSAKFKKNLGYGAFSNVMLYALEDNGAQGDDAVVVKQFHFNNTLYASKEEMRKHYDFAIQILYKEYDMGTRLNHKNIIKTIDIDETNGCIIFENFVGIDLLDLLNDEDIQPRTKLIGYFKQVIDGVEFIHQQGVAHMDIKLENVIVKMDTDDVKLIDFGYAKTFMNDTGYVFSTCVCGTDCYFPPEYFTNIRYQPDKVDMWCCGILLYNIVYDRIPWEYACSSKDRKFDIYKNKCKPEMPNVLFPDVTKYGFDNEDSAILYELFTGLLEVNPNKRFDVHTTKKLLGMMKC